MAQQVRGVVARSKGAPVTIETIVIPDPGPGEAVVAIQACGVCHTDLHYREGGTNDEFPFLLGPGAAGHAQAGGEGGARHAPGRPGVPPGPSGARQSHITIAPPHRSPARPG